MSFKHTQRTGAHYLVSVPLSMAKKLFKTKWNWRLWQAAIIERRCQSCSAITNPCPVNTQNDEWQSRWSITNDHEFRTLFRGTAESNLNANDKKTRTTSVLIPNTWLQIAHCEQMMEGTTMHANIWMKSLGADDQTMQWTVQNSLLNKQNNTKTSHTHT